MVHKIWFDGVCSRDFGMWVSGENTFDAPERDVTFVDVSGRNGSLIIDNGRFKNIAVSYPAFITSSFRENAQAAREWLLSRRGYKRLEDEYNPDVYRMAQFTGPFDFDMRFLNYSGETELVFNCKPQRFLKSGEFPIDLVSGQKIFNFWQPALPLLMISGVGDGQIIVGNSTVTITGMAGNITLDSETQNAYSGMTNMNNHISLTGGFPILRPGSNSIAWSGGINDVKMIPRWWCV